MNDERRARAACTSWLALTTGLLFTALALAFAASDAAAATGARLRLADQEYFGKYYKGEIFTRKVTVYNDGDEPLAISRVTSKCSCSKAIGFDKTIAPGQSGTFELEVNTNRIAVGRFGKQINVFSNDAAKQRTVFFFNIEVVALVKIDPDPVVLAGLYGEEKFVDVALNPATSTGFSLVDVRTKRGRDGKSPIEIKEREQKAPSQYRLRLATGKAPHARQATDAVYLDIDTDDGRQLRDLMVPILIKHQDFVIVEPDGGLFFRNPDTDPLLGDNPKPIHKTITVHCGEPNQDFEITDVHVEGAPEGVFRTEVRALEAKRRYAIDVIISVYQKKTFIRARLIIKTTETRAEETTVKVQALFGKLRGHAPR